MATRCSALFTLGLSLLFASGCPEPGDEAGNDSVASAGSESGDTGMPDPIEDDTNEDPGGGVEEGGDVRPPLDTGDGDEGDGDPGDGDPGDGDGDGDEGPIDDPERCWDRTWAENTLPVTLFDNTIGRTDDGTASCGIDPAPDFQLGFVAPWTGSFTFDTEGSSFDTVLYVNEGECREREIECNDDFIGLDSKLTLELEESEIVTVTVDGTGAFEEGPLVLSIYEAVELTCDTEKITPPLPTQVVGDTTNALDELASDCGGDDTPERIYEFHPPGPSTYRFDTVGSSFDTVLYALTACDEAPLVCNDDTDFELHSELIVDVSGGDKLLIVVDGHDSDDVGPFVLNVEQL